AHDAGEFGRGKAVEVIRVAGAAAVEPVAHGANQLVWRERVGPRDHDVAGGNLGLGVEGAAARAGAEPAARHEGVRRLAAVDAELLLESRIVEETLRLVPGGERAHENAVFDQVGPSRGQPFAAD